MNIAVFSQIPDSASTYYRALFPFKQIAFDLTRFHYDLIGGDTLKLTTADLFKYDLCFMMRPHDPSHITLLQALKNMHIPIWIDFDDDLFSIPYNHKEYEYFALDSTHHAILQGVALADVVTVTTDELKDSFVSRGADKDKIEVIPNAVNDYLFPEPAQHNLQKKETIGWRGGFTHDRDLVTIEGTVRELTDKNFRFIFMGHRPYAIEKSLRKGAFSRLPEQDIFSYFQSLKEIALPFFVVPLEDTPLNRSKSNIAFQEATWLSGSLVFSPDWFKDGGISYKSESQLIRKITELSGEIASVRQAYFDQQVALIRSKYLLSNVNDLRLAILDRFI